MNCPEILELEYTLIHLEYLCYSDKFGFIFGFSFLCGRIYMVVISLWDLDFEQDVIDIRVGIYLCSRCFTPITCR